ncbi:pyridine nucleotide-disulfide oxidoreductase, partial [Streptococcus pneumoniae]
MPIFVYHNIIKDNIIILFVF